MSQAENYHLYPANIGILIWQHFNSCVIRPALMTERELLLSSVFAGL